MTHMQADRLIECFAAPCAGRSAPVARVEGHKHAAQKGSLRDTSHLLILRRRSPSRSISQSARALTIFDRARYITLPHMLCSALPSTDAFGWLIKGPRTSSTSWLALCCSASGITLESFLVLSGYDSVIVVTRPHRYPST